MHQIFSRHLYKGRLPISYQLIVYVFCDNKTFAVVVHTISLNQVSQQVVHECNQAGKLMQSAQPLGEVLHHKGTASHNYAGIELAASQLASLRLVTMTCSAENAAS